MLRAEFAEFLHIIDDVVAIHHAGLVAVDDGPLAFVVAANDGEKVVKSKDFKTLVQRELVNGEWVETPIVMALNATSNVLQYFTEGGMKISVRPSGTEPKIKFYFEIPAQMPTPADYDKAVAEAEAKVPAIKASMGI